MLKQLEGLNNTNKYSAHQDLFESRFEEIDNNILKKHFLLNHQLEKNKLTTKKRKKRKKFLVYNDDYSMKKSVSVTDLELIKTKDDQKIVQQDIPKEVPMFLNMYDPFRNNLEIVQDYLRKEKLEENSNGLETIDEKKSSMKSSKSIINKKESETNKMNININTFNNIIFNNNKDKHFNKPSSENQDYSPVFSPSNNSKKTRLRIMVIGGKETGKTSFIETFIRYVEF